MGVEARNPKTSLHYHAVDARRAWNPGAFARLPWLALGALILSILGMFASVGILIASDGAVISSWRFTPSTYLSIASTVTNVTLHFAISEGIGVAWWRRALKEKTSITDLHRCWNVGNNAWAASFAGRHFNLIALACLLVTVSPINGPLLQRASRVVTGPADSSTTVKIMVTPQIPLGWTGYISGHNIIGVSLLKPKFASVVQDFYNQVPIQMAGTGCEGICSATVEAAGFAVNCSAYELPFNLTVPTNATSDEWPSAQVFEISFYSEIDYSPTKGVVEVRYKRTADCVGNIVVQDCTLQNAIVDYPVTIDGNQSTISLAARSSIWDDVVKSIVTIPPENWASNSTLGGLYTALTNRYVANATSAFDGVGGYALDATGVPVYQYTNLSEHSETGLVPWQDCSLHFNNPLGDMLEAARELMFRTAVAAANSSTIQQASASQTAAHTIYVSDYLFLILATVLTSVAIIAVTLIFNGYWYLGRPVTMSPIEIAKAFNAPILRSEDSNATASDIVHNIGDRRVQYGAVVNDHQTETISQEEDPAIVKTPVSQLRLEIADPHFVLVPRQGWKFGG